ncbi:MAG: hypothetical protein OXG92_05125 [Chloroflexi bacterium]|nr:hypothetical protein [Chloroflexota bacterium]MCY3582821.1 hypothetical protein [Chloroflexota bacterium]MCY3715828.1 hypothetical protein [Chloroflexota bacterium]MDE2651913.1 hypothetical protein [Chloroflexota bacterium]MXV93488.1 TIR domain-containing protein [Chloroflexota bacterium]
MIRITYAPADQALAHSIRADLSQGASPAQSLLVVLASDAALAEPSVQSEIAQAQQQGSPILPILTGAGELPPALAKLRPLDFRDGYQSDLLLQRVDKLTNRRRDIRKANRRALLVFAGLATIMFSLAIAGMSAGLVAFPVAEYNEEATFQAQWIDGLIRETLEYVQPRSTADAMNFAATYAAAPTRLHFYVRGTATAVSQAPEP